MIHYIYKITSFSGKFYIGRHSTLNLNDGYLGSGKWVKSIKSKSVLTKEILAIADSFEDLLTLEEKFINENINDANNMNFNNKPVGFATGDLNWNRSEEAKIIKSSRKKGLTLQEQFGEEKANLIREKIASSKRGKKTNKTSWNNGLTASVETKQKLSSIVSNRMNSLTSNERKEKYGNVGNANGFFNKKHSEDTLNTLRNKQKNNREVNRKICPHCGKDIDAANYARYHGNKCKNLKH